VSEGAACAEPACVESGCWSFVWLPAALTPVPLRGTLRTLLEVLSVTLRIALKLPAPRGANFTLIAQLAPGATAARKQSPADTLKLRAPAPESATLPILSGVDPLLVMVTVRVSAPDFTSRLPKSTPAGLKPTDAEAPVPLNETV
jgi:hypothetical protein